MIGLKMDNSKRSVIRAVSHFSVAIFHAHFHTMHQIEAQYYSGNAIRMISLFDQYTI